jgi:hypothetical protein
MSNATPRTIALGNATITIINEADMMVDLAQEIDVPESEWRPLYREGFAGSRPIGVKLSHRQSTSVTDTRCSGVSGAEEWNSRC